jgi:uncharacterized membrane protein YdjX (TVP38/TMEM64 family)
VNEQGEGPEEHEAPPLIGLLGLVAGIVLLALLLLAIEPLRTGVGDALSGDTAELRADLRGLGVGGVLITLTLAFAHVVVWYPAEILDAAVGFVYGFWGGFVLVMAGWLGNAVLAYWVGRHAARPVLYRFIGHQRFDRLEHLVEAGGIPLLLGMRVVPVIPFSFFSIVAGAARVNMGTFLWTTAVGYLPLTAVFVYLGTRLESLSPTDPILLAIVAVLVVGMVIGHRFHRRLTATPRRAASGPPATTPQPESDT